jgi:hypothetical protein
MARARARVCSWNTCGRLGYGSFRIDGGPLGHVSELELIDNREAGVVLS